VKDDHHISTEGFQKACAHCDLPVPKRLLRNGPSFCCSGCETVFQILQQSGFDQTYYRLRDASGKRSLSKPAVVKTGVGVLDELDSAGFLESHSTRLDGGTYRTHLYLDGVHCAACVWLVERIPEEVTGVSRANLNLPRARLTVEWNPELVSLGEIASWLARFGYPVQPRIDGEEAPESREERRLLIKMGVSWALAGNIMLLALALYSGLGADSPNLYNGARSLSLFLAIPAVLYGGSVFFRKAWHSLRLSVKKRSLEHLHMDTPISLGILVGFSASVWATISGAGDIWFDSIAVLIAALLSARWLQLRARRMAGDSTEQLLALLPTLARLKSGRSVRADDLMAGDLIEVRAGELIPVDGTIEAGSSLVNSAILTGESSAVRLNSGDSVNAGTTNETSSLIVCVEASGPRTRIGQLLTWVSDSDNESPRILYLADRIGGYFTVAVLTISAFTAIFWYLIAPDVVATRIIALLVITCPCALGMATPLALAVGSGRAARRGIFVKSESVVDWLNRVDTVIVDKTGTLTQGTMAIENWIGDASVLKLAASIESGITHPIARAFEVQFDGEKLFDPSEVTTHPGKGIKGVVNGMELAVGVPEWVMGDNKISESYRFFAENERNSGKTVVAIGGNQIQLTLVSLSDPIRAGAGALVYELTQSGKSVILCSGDNDFTTTIIGLRLGLSPGNCRGDHSPEDKLALMHSLIESGHIVAMIGDGVNDAAALRAAHVGIAVEGASAASRVAADVFVTRPGLEAVAELLRESRIILHVINRNLGFSLLYNLGGGVAAILGLVTPIFAAVAMPVSSFIVILSSIGQRTFRTKRQTQ